MDITLHPSSMKGTIQVPASKSQTIRALLIATFCGGVSTIVNPLDSQDTASCMEACIQLGAVLTRHPLSNSLTVDASNVGNWNHLTLDCGNSGTTLYLAAAMAASLGKKITYCGDAQLNSRPVSPLLSSLADFGIQVEKPQGLIPVTPPFTLSGTLKGGVTTIVCETSQYLSALLLASPLAEQDSVIFVPLLHEKPYVEMTLSWLLSQGITIEHNSALTNFRIPGRQHYRPFTAQVAGDFSSATFFFCGAALSKGSITITGLDSSDSQGDKEILSVLEQMGCTISIHDEEITLTGPDRLSGGVFDLNAMPDALPALAVTACFAHEPVHILNVPQARIKETDRIAVMANLLTSLGAEVEELADGLIIRGNGSLKGGTVSGHGDHRIIMAMAIASLKCDSALTITEVDAVSVTFPDFFKLLNRTAHNITC